MKRLIDPIALKIALYASALMKDGKTLTEIIDEQPPVEPEIVTCEECKHWDTSWKPSTDRKCFYCPVVDCFVDGDFWCKNGERKAKNDGQTDFTAGCD